MPTNIAEPIWACDICRQGFGGDRAAAQRCESAGPPVAIPNGALLLDYEQQSTGDGTRPAGFHLHPLYRYPDRIGTVAATHHTRAGHFLTYAIGVDPRRHWDASRGRYRWPQDGEPRRVAGTDLHPHRPGALQIRARRRIGAHRGIGDRADHGWILDAVGLSRGRAPGIDVDGRSARWVRPLTAEVKAVLDALHAYPVFLEPHPELRRRRDGRPATVNTGPALGSLAFGTAGRVRPDGPANARRALWFLRGADEQKLIAQINAMWREWRGGSGRLDHGSDPNKIWDDCPVGVYDVPVPRLRSTHDHLTASKLTSRLKALIAATGVDWPARTNATAYCSLLITKTLEYRMDTERTLFPGVRVVAVRGRKGGVGKSTVAAALARRLAQDGHTVVLVDFDLAGPSQHLIHNLGPVVTDTDRVMIQPAPAGVDRLQVFSPGQIFGPDTTPQWSDTTVAQWTDFVGSSLDLADADIVVLDMPPGGNGLHAHLTGDRGRADVEVHVTTGHPLALADTERDLAAPARPGRRYLVENLSRISGTDPDGRTTEIRLFGITTDAPELAARTGTAWAGSLPWVAGPFTTLADSTEIRALAHHVSD